LILLVKYRIARATTLPNCEIRKGFELVSTYDYGIDVVEISTNITIPKLGLGGHMLSSETSMKAGTTVVTGHYCLEIMSSIRYSRLSELVAVWVIARGSTWRRHWRRNAKGFF
jgi:hypothetical protein